MFKLLIFILFGSFLLVAITAEAGSGLSLKNVELSAEPPQGIVGKTIKLSCNIDIEGVELYSVKLYHKHSEFFRYMPGENSTHVFPSPHFELKNEITQSGISVEIQPSDVAASGTYSCEVTTDAPIFETAVGAKNITVVPSEPQSTTSGGVKPQFLSVSTQMVAFARSSSSNMSVELTITPQQSLIGETVTIQCDYDLGGEKLYFMKLYKGPVEFYRYSPSEHPSQRIFPNQYLDVVKMHRNSIQFRPTNLKSSGTYTCEVTTEGTFATMTVQQNITVLSQPHETTTETVAPKAPFVQLKVTPPRPTAGQSVKLEWTYDVGFEVVYAIKIYKDSHEFYRYMPSSEPHRKLFLVKGVNVDASSSSNTSLVLSSVTSETSGIYICEVSTEAPLFTTVHTEKRIEIQ